SLRRKILASGRGSGQTRIPTRGGRVPRERLSFATGRHRGRVRLEPRTPLFVGAMRNRRWVALVTGLVVVVAAVGAGVVAWQVRRAGQARSRAALTRTV